MQFFHKTMLAFHLFESAGFLWVCLTVLVSVNLYKRAEGF